MLVRVISSVVLFPVLFFLVFYGGMPLKIGTIFVSLVGMYEFYRAIYKKIMPIHYLGFVTAIVYLLSIDFIYRDGHSLITIFLLFFLISLIFMVINHKKISIFDVSVTLFSIIYIPFMFSTIYLIKNLPLGNYLVWFPFICAWACDTGAYFVGITMGKHKITPKLSPKKTIEGAIGGVLFSAIFCSVYTLFILNNMDRQIIINNIAINKYIFIALAFLLGSITAVFAQFGDLTASAIKRKFDIKDYGNLIPGHGGILDRFDSVIFTSGVCYVIIMSGTTILGLY